MPDRLFRLGDGSITLDARPDRLDLRDRAYLPRVASLPPAYPPRDEVTALLPRYLASDRVLDQGSEGACTGFGLAGVVNYLLWRRDPAAKAVSPRMLYHLARFYDEWPGEDYSGSSCRGALKGWQKHGVCERPLWPYTVDLNGRAPSFEAPLAGWAEDAVTRPLGTYYRIDKASVVDLQAAIVEIGAIYVSADVHAGWSAIPQAARRSKVPFVDYRELPVIEPSDRSLGGHAFAIVGYTADGFVVQNSWGSTWGRLGFAVLTYADWVAHGTDAWVAALGVPIAQGGIAKVARLGPPSTDRFGLRAGADLQARRTGLSLQEGRESLNSRSGRPFFDCLSSAGAYNQSLVMGNDGGLINRIVDAGDASAAVERVAFERARAWFASPAAGGKRRIAIYAHGGLNKEAASVGRIRVMAPYFLANGIYPVFVTWRTGWAETLGDVLADRLKAFLPTSEGFVDVLERIRDKAFDAVDRTIEAFSAEVGVKTQWMQMKQNAFAGAGPGSPIRGLVALAGQLRRLADEGPVELHLVGHSAGSIVTGHLLGLLKAQGLGVSTCTLFAPACSLDFALQTYRPAIESGMLARRDFHIHLLSDQRERGDNVGRVYHKSLLYLVARALESAHKTPLLGMASAFDLERATPEYWNEATLPAVAEWNGFYWGRAAPRGFAKDGRGLDATQASTLHVEDRIQVNCGPRRIPAAHGAFDNDVDTVSATLERIRGGPLAQRVVNLDY